MLKASIITGLVLLSSCANAFYDAAPIVIWSSRSTLTIQTLKDNVSPVPSPAELMNSLLQDQSLCSLDAVVVVGQTKLHATQLASLPSNAYLKSHLTGAASKAHFPYIPLSGDVDPATFAHDIATFCGSVSADWFPGQKLEKSEKRVLQLTLPEVNEKSWASYDKLLHEHIEEIAGQMESYAVILLGTRGLDLSLVAKRQQPNLLSAPGFISHPPSLSANITVPVGGILARYQVLTPGLLVSLLIAFGLLIPLLMIGINALASIQNPIRTEAPKGPSLEKKNQ